MEAKTFVVTVSYVVDLPLLGQFNLPDAQQSITFLVKTSNELTEKTLTDVAYFIVKDKMGRGLASEFKTTSIFDLPNARFYNKVNRPVLIELNTGGKPEEIKEAVVKAFDANPVK